MTASVPDDEDVVQQPKKPTIKAVIFDMDGTLLDTEALSCRSVIESFAILDMKIPDEHLNTLKEGGMLLPWELKRQILGLRGWEWVPIVLQYAQTKWNVEMDLDWTNGWENVIRYTEKDTHSEERENIVKSFMEAWEIRLNELCSEVEACAGAPELVEALRAAKIPLAIATSSRMVSVNQKKVKHEKMFQAFQEIVTGDDVKRGKPAPDIYIEAARRLGVRPSECLVFEDALNGAHSGKRAGCHVIAIPDSRMKEDMCRFLPCSDEVLEENLWQFSGSQWGIDIDMSELYLSTLKIK